MKLKMRLWIDIGFMLTMAMIYSNLLIANAINVETKAVASTSGKLAGEKQEEFFNQRFAKFIPFYVAGNKPVQRNWGKYNSISGHPNPGAFIKSEQCDVSETSFTSYLNLLIHGEILIRKQ